MKRVLLPLILLGLTLGAFADADLTSARIYRNQGDLHKALDFFNKTIEKNPDLYAAYYERGELYGMIATDNTKKGVLRDIAGDAEAEDRQYKVLGLMLDDFNVVKSIEDPKQLKKQKKNLKKIDNIIEDYWTTYYNEAVDADVTHAEKLREADSLMAVGDTTTLAASSDTLTTYRLASITAERAKDKVVNSTNLCILLKPDEWNPYALKAQALDRSKEIDAANEVWAEALVALNASGLKEEDRAKYDEAWRIIELHRLQNYYNTDQYEKTIEVSDEILAVCEEEGVTSASMAEMEDETRAVSGHCRDAYVFKAFAIISMVTKSKEDEDLNINEIRSEAIAVLKDANMASPDDSAIPFYIGQYYLANGDTSNALEWWRKYTEMDTEDYEVLFQIGYIYLEGGTFIDYTKAEAIYQEVVARHPEQCTGWINLGVSQIKQDKTKIGADNVKKGEECSKNSGE